MKKKSPAKPSSNVSSKSVGGEVPMRYSDRKQDTCQPRAPGDTGRSGPVARERFSNLQRPSANSAQTHRCCGRADAAPPTPFASSRIDHVSIQVNDLQRSIDFYRKVFGLEILNQDEPNEIVRMGTTRIIVSLHHKGPTGIVDHFAIAVDDFDRESAMQSLAALGLTAEQNLDYGFYVRDPEGIPVQMVAS